jgi:N-acylneuraminate cytidylyltransferase
MKSKSGVVAVIPARGGSKGVARKNIRQLAGKPLIAYAIQTALASSMINRVIVSTEDPEIAEIARQWGAEVPFMRPADLAHDDSPEWLVWQHAIRYLQAEETGTRLEAFVCISPTSPLRAVEDVESCIQLLLESDADMVITVSPAARNPYFNIVGFSPDGYAQLAIQSPTLIHRRQDAPLMYDITTVAYASRPEFILKAGSIFEGKIKAVVVPAERALDIDTELDFKVAEILLNESLAAQNIPAKNMAGLEGLQ